MKNRIIKGVLWTVTLLWMAVIFWFSDQNAEKSSKMSMNVVTRFIISHYEGYDSLDTDEKIEKAEKIEYFVRKTAHYLEYCFLGLLYGSILIAYGRDEKYRHKYLWLFLMTGFFVCLYASTDEIHQLFVPGRSGRIQDVLLDTAGGLTAGLILALSKFLYFCVRKHNFT